MIKRTLQRGFTLIELLVVIAIIGILAAVVLTSLNDARDNANDASAKSSITSIRAQAEIFYNENNYSYANLCAAAEITRLTGAATAQGAQNLDCDSSATDYAVEVQLRSGQYFCVDSGGNAGEQAASKGAAATQC
ncbi:type II secretion system protein [Candidatus Kaiserbacteria bacterium]|nr:type II secretion system protein [Candidatus Kaiserbacteria bacterium]